MRHPVQLIHSIYHLYKWFAEGNIRKKANNARYKFQIQQVFVQQHFLHIFPVGCEESHANVLFSRRGEQTCKKHNLCQYRPHLPHFIHSFTVSQIFGFYFQIFPYFGERIEKHNSCTSLISTQSIILHGTIKCLAIDYRVCSTDIYCIDFAYFPLQPFKILLIFSLNKQIGIPPNVRFE